MAEAAWEKKAQNVVVLEVGCLTDVTEYLVICSASSDRGVRTIVDNVEKRYKLMGKRPLGVEGYAEGRWVLFDADDVVVHVFYQPIRELFDLEGLWIDAPRVELPFESEMGEEARDALEDRA